MTLVQAFAVVLVVLTPIHWWALIVIVLALRRRPDVHALRELRKRFLVTAVAATMLAAVAANALLGMPLPRGASFALFVAFLIGISIPPVLFLVDHYRR